MEIKENQDFIMFIKLIIDNPNKFLSYIKKYEQYINDNKNYCTIGKKCKRYDKCNARLMPIWNKLCSARNEAIINIGKG